MSRKTATNNGIFCRYTPCTYKAPVKLLRHHEALCDYGTQICPIFKCANSVTLSAIRTHCLKEHSNLIRRAPSYKFHYNIFKDSYLNDTFDGLRYFHLILNVSDELFQGEFSYAKATGLMRWGVNYLDKKRINIKFHFILTFENFDEDIYVENCMPFYKDDFNDSIGCQISFGKMISYCNQKGELTFTIEIRDGEKPRNAPVVPTITSVLGVCNPLERVEHKENLKLPTDDVRYRRTKTIGSFTTHNNAPGRSTTPVPSKSEFLIARSNSVSLNGSNSQSTTVFNRKKKRTKKK